MDGKLRFPGLSNTWTMPIENRLDMELTGIKTPVGIKIQGPGLEGIEELGVRMQQLLSTLPEMRSIFAEHVAQGFYINIEVNRAEAARYGLTVGDVQRVIASGIGGANIAENVEGRERYPVSVRYAPDFRDNIDKLRQVLVATPSNGQIPLGNLAQVSFSKGPSMIRDEDAALTGYVYLDLNTKDYGGFVQRADRLLREKLALPAGYSFKWSWRPTEHSVSEMKTDRQRHRPRGNIMGPAERREEIIQSRLVRHINDSHSRAHLALVSSENVVVTNGDIEKVAGGDARRIVVVILGPRGGNT
jgi:Cu(I)/Ag(I) efflux system membrane protein CusA/SilA